MQGIQGQMGIGHVALFAEHPKAAVEGAPATILDQVPEPGAAGRLPHQAPVDALTARLQGLYYSHRAIHRRAFLVAG
jgi:hypothetical protein